MHRCAIRTPLRRRQARQPCSDERRGTLRGGSDVSRRTGGRSSVAQRRHPACFFTGTRFCSQRRPDAVLCDKSCRHTLGAPIRTLHGSPKSRHVHSDLPKIIFYLQFYFVTALSNANQEIVAATQKNRRFLDTYWDLIEKIIGFGTGAAPPIDRRSAVSLTPMVIEL